MAELGRTNISASPKSAMSGYPTTCGEYPTTTSELSSASDQGLEPGVALKIAPPPGIYFCKPAPVLGVVGEIPLKQIDRLLFVAELGADKGLVSHKLTAGIDRPVCSRPNEDSASTVGKTSAPGLTGPPEDVRDHDLSLATVVLALLRWGGECKGRGPAPSLIRIRPYTLRRHDPELTPCRKEMMWESVPFHVAPLLGVYK